MVPQRAERMNVSHRMQNAEWKERMPVAASLVYQKSDTVTRM